MLHVLLRGVAALLEGMLSRRGLASAFLLGATTLVMGGWLRPPLSADIRGVSIPLGIGKKTLAAEEILQGPERLPADSAGLLLLAVIAAGTALVLWHPQALGLVAGLLLCSALAANAAVAFNHPALIEMLDREFEQRRQIASMSAETPEGTPMSPEENPMAAPNNGRIGLAGAPEADEQRADFMRGWVYVLYGYWLIPWALAGVLFGSPGPLRRRCAAAALWTVLGVAMAGFVCSERLHAEYQWSRALTLEGQGDYGAAQEALQAAVALFPEFEQLERTWLLAGKLDYRQRRATPAARFFHA